MTSIDYDAETKTNKHRRKPTKIEHVMRGQCNYNEMCRRILFVIEDILMLN